MSVCPFCPLHCDDINPQRGDFKGCDVARYGYGIKASTVGSYGTKTSPPTLSLPPQSAPPVGRSGNKDLKVARIGNKAVSLTEAMAEAGRLLRAAKAPLFTATRADITTQRQVLELAKGLGASVADQGNRVYGLKSHTTSLAECALRADWVLMVGDFPRYLRTTALFEGKKLKGNKLKGKKLKGGKPSPDGDIFTRFKQKVLATAKVRHLTKEPLAQLEQMLASPPAEMEKASYAVVILCPTEPSYPLLYEAACELIEKQNSNHKRAALLAFNPLVGSSGMSVVSVAMTSKAPPLNFSNLLTDAPFKNPDLTLKVDLLGIDPSPCHILVGRVDNKKAKLFIPARMPKGAMLMRGDGISVVRVDPPEDALGQPTENASGQPTENALGQSGAMAGKSAGGLVGKSEDASDKNASGQSSRDALGQPTENALGQSGAMAGKSAGGLVGKSEGYSDANALLLDAPSLIAALGTNSEAR